MSVRAVNSQFSGKWSSIKGKLGLMRELQPVFQNPFETFNPLRRMDTYLYETDKNFAMFRTKNNELVKRSLELVGLALTEIGGKYPSEMSGGQLQRVSIARALISNPSLLIADEPLSMIDASLRMSVVNLFKSLKEEQGVSIIYITHDLATAYYVSDRIAIMLRGQIVEIGSGEQVLDDPLHPCTQLLTTDSVREHGQESNEAMSYDERGSGRIDPLDKDGGLVRSCFSSTVVFRSILSE